MTTFVCIKVGEKYGPEYVHNLEKMIERHTTLTHRFICLTDNPTGLKCNWDWIGTPLPGWWSKLILFKPHKALRNNRFVFIDLDTVIVDNIDFLAAYTGPFCILKDFWNPGYNSSVIAMIPEAYTSVWSNYHHEDWKGILSSDQDWISSQVKDADIWQERFPNKIGSYKADRLEKSPGDFALICFHGEPKPHSFTEGWVYNGWRN